MQTALNRLLLLLAGSVTVLDAVWIACGHFTIDAAPYLLLGAAVPACAGGAYYYGKLRAEPALSAMFSAAAFLMVFPAASCLLSYLALTIAGPRVDFALASFDRALGISWPAIMGFAASHPLLTQILSLAYSSIVVQTLLLVVLLGCLKQEKQLYGLCLAIAIGATITIAVWTAFPSFGAYSVYPLPNAVALKLNLVEGADYGRQLTTLLKNGPGLISPKDLRGIIGFPSYHTVQALILLWYTRHIRHLRWVSLLLNLLVIAATPIHGGHHVADLMGGGIVAVVAIALADTIVRKLWAAYPAASFSLEKSPEAKIAVA